MNGIKLPEKICGKWIFRKRLLTKNDTMVLMRREFSFSPDNGTEVTLLISAGNYYQLFINGRLAGAGPRAHQSAGTSYVDVHDMSYLLEPGLNVIAVRLFRSFDPERGDSSRIPGLWCQMQCNSQNIVCSDENWQICEADFLTPPRAKVSSGSRFTMFDDLRRIAPGWMEPDFKCGSEWSSPDFLTDPGEEGAKIEIHPVQPDSINSTLLDFIRTARGKAASMPLFSTIRFPENICSGTGVGVSYIYSDSPYSVQIRLFSDFPFKLFCNKEKVFDGDCARNTPAQLNLQNGWNRLVMFAPIFRNSMGVMMLFDTPDPGVIPLCDMLDSAEPGWCVGGPLKVKYANCTPAVAVETLPRREYMPSGVEEVTDIWDLLRNTAVETAADNTGELLKTGESELFQLDSLHSGFLRISLEAHDGDIVDLIIGTAPAHGIFPESANGDDREVLSCICREGSNEILTPFPVDCQCVMIHVRSSISGIKAVELAMDEFSLNFPKECLFNCSDDFYNRMWQTGRAALFRSAATVFPVDSAPAHDIFMLDAMIEAFNVAAVFGDGEYITARLRQFADAQLEDGSIPALSAGSDYDEALFHQFFFSGWVLYNYRFSSNLVELRSLIPKVDRLRNYLISLLDSNEDFIDPAMLPAEKNNHEDNFTSLRSPAVLNALFCRFMMSASELYEQAGLSGEAQTCRKYFRKTAEQLIKKCFDAEAGLFADSPITPETDEEFSLAGNFFPMLAGIKTGECFETFIDTFFDRNTAEPRTAEAESPYFHFLFLEMLFALGQKAWGLQHFRNYWGKRMDFKNGAWKAPFTNHINSTGFAKGSSIAPNLFLIREIAGVRIALPAHSVIYFDPAFEYVDHAEAAIPTAGGRIHIKWEKQESGGIDVSIYSSHPLKVIPEFPPEIIQISTFRLSDNVQLVKAKEEQ